MRTLTTELNRAVFSRSFLAAAAGTLVVLCIGAFDAFKMLFQGGFLEYGTHATALLTALDSDTMRMALPVLAALPCASGFVEDWRSGYLRHCLPRAGRQGYIAAKAGAAAIAGGLCVLAGIAAAHLIFLAAFLPAESAAPEGMQSLVPELMGRSCLFALCAALWSATGLALSAATLSVHMAYAFPFILCYVLVILCARYFPGVVILSPEEWLKPGRLWPGGNWGIALLIAELTAVASLLFRSAAMRRLRDE